MDALLEVIVSEQVVSMDCEETVCNSEKASESAEELRIANLVEEVEIVESIDETDMDKSSSLDSEEIASSSKIAPESIQEPLIANSEEVVEIVEIVESDLDKSSSLNESDGIQNLTEVSAMETESEQTSHPTEISGHAEESKVQTPEPGHVVEVTDESNSVTENQGSAVELKGAPSAAVQESSDKTANQSEKLDTTTPKTDASDVSVAIDSEANAPKQASSTDLDPKKTGQTKSQLLSPKVTTTKIIPLSKLGPNGKPVSIKILSKDKKTPVNVNVTPVFKPVSGPTELANKKLPLILPKISPSSLTIPTSSIPSKNIDDGTAPQNYLLIQTKDGVSFLPIEQMTNGAIKTSGAEKVSSVCGPQNINICKTPNSSSLGVLSASTTSKTNPSILSLPSQLKIPPPIFSTPATIRPATVTSSAVSRQLSTIKVSDETEKEIHPLFVGLCKHPTCSVYRGKVMEELHVKEKRRNRRLKTGRVAKERSVRRAATLKRQVKNLERQRTVISELEFFPDEVCKTLMKSQLKPRDGVRAKTLREKELKNFATQLHSISPKAYDIVRGIFNRVLPESPSTDNWNIPVPEAPVAEKAGNSDEGEGIDSESDGDEEMSELLNL